MKYLTFEPSPNDNDRHHLRRFPTERAALKDCDDARRRGFGRILLREEPDGSESQCVAGQWEPKAVRA